MAVLTSSTSQVSCYIVFERAVTGSHEEAVARPITACNGTGNVIGKCGEFKGAEKFGAAGMAWSDQRTPDDPPAASMAFWTYTQTLAMDASLGRERNQNPHLVDWVQGAPCGASARSRMVWLQLWGLPGIR
jgi:hypothetical protein